MGMAAPGAIGALKWLLPEPLGPRHGCSQSHWGFKMLASCFSVTRSVRSKKHSKKLFDAAQLKLASSEAVRSGSSQKLSTWLPSALKATQKPFEPA